MSNRASFRIGRPLLVAVALILTVPPLTAAGVPSERHPGIADETTADTDSARTAAAVVQAAAPQPLVFEPNRGQADRDVEFMARGRDSSFSVKRTELVMHLWRAAVEQDPLRVADLHIRFLGANSHLAAVGTARMRGVVHYSHGRDRSKWIQNAGTRGTSSTRFEATASTRTAALPAARLALIGRASAIVLKGQATAQHAGQVDSVGTSLALCAPTVAPADCKNADGFQFWGPMTGATITPIPIAAEQNIQVTVTLSFS